MKHSQALFIKTALIFLIILNSSLSKGISKNLTQVETQDYPQQISDTNVFNVPNADERILVILKNGNKVKCVYEREDSEKIYVSIFRNGNKVSTEMSKDKIQSIVLPGSVQSNQHLRIGINGGYSYRTAKIAESVPDEFKEYVKGLKSGYHLDGDFTYYFSDKFGVGLKYAV